VELDEALEKAYQSKLRERLDNAVDKILGEQMSQTRVERALGLSPGYLSKLKQGRRNPSAELVVLLGLMSKAPQSRIAEAEEVMNSGGRKRAAG
jgi:hypothetical protein